ncbi:probable protein phosphatase 2C 5 [Camellia sinensis]|uniref:probable protein phosphatase 2C 5 n=1 Tax=Camellia sinensis TaxID=4442 RepID=UPI001035C445|nr:probable protein phosphatase 2C 5 [Camellia sinensis]
MIYLRGFRTLRFLRSEFGDLSRDQIVNGRICGDISVSLAFGDMRLKTKKNDLEAVNFVRNQLQQHRDVQLACEALGRAALDRRSRDNISIVIADLGRTDWQSLPRQKENFVYELGQAFATIGIVSLGIWMFSLLST